jgi:hypothetical protein
MDYYGISLVTGATGLVAMALGGLSHAAGHAGHGHGGGHGGHGGHAGHDVHAGATGHGGHGGHAGHGHHAGGHETSSWQSLLSPRLLFSALVGFGAGGLLATPLGEPFRLAGAIVAAAAFEMLLVGPIWRFFFRFESSPAVTLDSALDDEARAVTSFDAQGCGLVALEVDGQLVQLLATLDADARQRGVRIRTGDLVRIAAVDPARGRCTVKENDR